MSIDVVTVVSRPDLEAQMGEAFHGVWPEFIYHDPVSQALVRQAWQLFPEFNLIALSDGVIVAGSWGACRSHGMARWQRFQRATMAR